MFNIELHNPDFVINCADLKSPSEIYQIMRDKKISRAYVYGMVYNPKPLIFDFIKVGMSCPNLGHRREHQVGERIVRQLAWVPNWESEHVKSSNGSDFWHNIVNFAIPYNKVPRNIDKNMLSVAVWDVTKRMYNSDFVSDDEEFTASCWAEGSLADQYKQFNNELPVLNFVDPSQNKIYKGPRISKNVFSEFFHNT